MHDGRILARLMAQAEARGGELVTLRALVEEASEAGAARALGALGLDDPRARRDMSGVWRDRSWGARTGVRGPTVSSGRGGRWARCRRGWG